MWAIHQIWTGEWKLVQMNDFFNSFYSRYPNFCTYNFLDPKGLLDGLMNLLHDDVKMLIPKQLELGLAKKPNEMKDLHLQRASSNTEFEHSLIETSIISDLFQGILSSHEF
eukprot:TRINITY_DN8967_c0_g1_i3.p1 TRINITY_DN8967_c0_g1~~TRINITY_DN8967_c0_g1_i3.p1  ORF type:complete len:111 (-),score=14.18 TRINITY_DN8967_c0_g1_i3:154-486(-)